MINEKLVNVSLALLIASTVLACGGDVQPAGPSASSALSSGTSDAAATLVTGYEVSPATVAGGNCALDAVGGTAAAGATAKAGADVMFSGWIADQTNRVPADARLVFRGAHQAYSAPIVTGGLRPDVAAALNSEALGLSGYNSLLKMEVVPGSYDLSIVHGAAGQAQECRIATTLVVTQ